MLALILGVVSASAGLPIPEAAASGLQLTVDLKIIMQTAIAGLMVWCLAVVRDSRAKAAAGVTKIAVIETELKNIKEDVDILVKRGNAK